MKIHLKRCSFNLQMTSTHLVVDLDPAEWYFCKKEEAMILKILIGVLLGGAAGFALTYLTRGIGSS